MDIKKMFETQEKFDEHVMDNHPELKEGDNVSWKVLATMVEVSECANEWRGFKKWSNDQAPRNYCMKCQITETPHECKNPLLEEYVDGLHLFVSIGIDLNIDSNELLFPPGTPKDSAQDLFISLHQDIAHIDLSRKEHHYQYTFIRFMELGLQLGFTFAQIEDAYYAKNKINHVRQDNGY